jgi:hypothetical protein
MVTSPNAMPAVEIPRAKGWRHWILRYYPTAGTMCFPHAVAAASYYLVLLAAAKELVP